MNAKTVLIVGAGGVLSSAVAQEFASAGYLVIGIRRDGSNAASNPDAAFNHMHYGDFHNRQMIQPVVNQIVEEQGAIDVLVYNAARLVVAPFLELSAADFEESWRASVSGAAASAQAVLPAMLGRRQGSMIFSGATAATRGTARFAAFSSAKFALRGLTQSLAREYQSQGIHIAHVVIDGLLRGSASVTRFDGREENSIDPAAVASSYRWLVEQPSSAWTLELDIRPGSERF